MSTGKREMDFGSYAPNSVRLHVCMCLEERPADLSRKAWPGSAEMSGCYGDLPMNASTEKYRMVKERRGEVGVGCVVGVSLGMAGWWTSSREYQGLKADLELSRATTVATARQNIIMEKKSVLYTRWSEARQQSQQTWWWDFPNKANLVSTFSSLRTMTQHVLDPTPTCTNAQPNIHPRTQEWNSTSLVPGKQQTLISILSPSSAVKLITVDAFSHK